MQNKLSQIQVRILFLAFTAKLKRGVKKKRCVLRNCIQEGDFAEALFGGNDGNKLVGAVYMPIEVYPIYRNSENQIVYNRAGKECSINDL